MSSLIAFKHHYFACHQWSQTVQTEILDNGSKFNCVMRNLCLCPKELFDTTVQFQKPDVPSHSQLRYDHTYRTNLPIFIYFLETTEVKNRMAINLS